MLFIILLELQQSLLEMFSEFGDVIGSGQVMSINLRMHTLHSLRMSVSSALFDLEIIHFDKEVGSTIDG